MNKLVLPLFTLIIGFVAGYYFSNFKSTNTPGTAATATTALYPSSNSISKDEAQMLVDTFGMYGMQDVNHKPGGKGLKTRSVYIPLPRLDSLVAALDAARKKDGTTDGLRIYFGRYPKMQLDKNPYIQPFMNTLILVATKLTRILPTGAKDSISIHLDYYGAPNSKTPMRMFVMDPLNREELCPNNCDGATLVCPDPNNPNCNTSN
jgi:hypothetical protein